MWTMEERKIPGESHSGADTVISKADSAVSKKIIHHT